MGRHHYAEIITRWVPYILLLGIWVFVLARRRAGQSKEVQPQAGDGAGAAGGVGVLVLCVAFLVLYWRKALSVPWTWTFDQVFAAGLLIAVSVGIVGWGRLWWLGGYPAVNSSLTVLGKQLSASQPLFTFKTMLLNILFWIVVAVALVFVFNWLQ